MYLIYFLMNKLLCLKIINVTASQYQIQLFICSAYLNFYNYVALNSFK